jgi:hypothetical protein
MSNQYDNPNQKVANEYDSFREKQENSKRVRTNVNYYSYYPGDLPEYINSGSLYTIKQLEARSIIIDINLDPKAVYYIRNEFDKNNQHSRFYCEIGSIDGVDDDEIILPYKRVYFKDAARKDTKERGNYLLIQVSRHFKGNLVLYKSNSQPKKLSIDDFRKMEKDPKQLEDYNKQSNKDTKIGNIDLDLLDTYEYTDHPNDRPKPLVYTINAYGQASIVGATRSGDDINIDYEQNVFVFEVKQYPGSHNASRVNQFYDSPAFMALSNFFAKPDKAVFEFLVEGGEKTAIDSSGVLTRNWLMQTITSAGVTVAEARDLITKLEGSKVRIINIKHRNPFLGKKFYVTFNGFAGNRKIFDATRYLTSNMKVLDITSGFGSAQGTARAITKGTLDQLKGIARVTFYLGIVVTVAEWWGDFNQIDPLTGQPKADVYNLWMSIGLYVGKAELGVLVGIATKQLLILLAGALGQAVGGWVLALIIVIAFVIGGIVSYFLDVFDKENEIGKTMANNARNNINAIKHMLGMTVENKSLVLRELSIEAKKGLQKIDPQAESWEITPYLRAQNGLLHYQYKPSGRWQCLREEPYVKKSW